MNEERTLQKIVKFDPVKAVINTLVKKCEEPSDMTTTTGRKENALKIRMCRDQWVTLEELRVEAKKEALEWGRHVDRVAGELDTELREIAAPHIAQKKQFDEEKREREEAEAKRIELIKSRIVGLTAMPQLDADATILQNYINTLRNCNCGKEMYAEFAVEAHEVREETLEKLNDMLAKRTKYDEDQAELKRKQQELDDREAKEKVIQDVVDKVNDLTQDWSTIDQDEINKRLDRLQDWKLIKGGRVESTCITVRKTLENALAAQIKSVKIEDKLAKERLEQEKSNQERQALLDKKQAVLDRVDRIEWLEKKCDEALFEDTVNNIQRVIKHVEQLNNSDVIHDETTRKTLEFAVHRTLDKLRERLKVVEAKEAVEKAEADELSEEVKAILVVLNNKSIEISNSRARVISSEDFLEIANEILAVLKRDNQ